MQNPARHAASAPLSDATASLCAGVLAKSQGAGDRRACPSPAARHLRPSAPDAETHLPGSRLLGRTPPALASLEGSPGHRQARDRDPLASRRVPPLLASPFPTRARAAARPAGSARADPPPCVREWLGGAEDPGRALEARVRRRLGDGLAISPEAATGSGPSPALEDVTPKPQGRHRGDRPLHCPRGELPGLLYVWFVIDHGRRRLIHFNVTKHPSARWVIQQLREAFPSDRTPGYLLLDRDSIFSAEVVAAIRSLGIDPVRTAYRSPWQNPIAKRWVGTC